jgi:class 3 adenylate cyclase/tetratricopeptide (TPR) repeat protein
VLICQACGERNPDRFRYCGVCGAELGSAAPESNVRKVVTAVFCDVVGSTALGDRLDAEAVRQIMASYFDRMRSVLERHGGTVEKFMGDAVFAIFGVPTLREDDALRAVTAAAEMREAIAQLRPELMRRFEVALEVRIGVNTGEVVAVPSDPDATVTGDIINVAARLEQAAGVGEILIGQNTFTLVRDAVRAELLPGLDLKGKPVPVPAYRLLEVASGIPGRMRHGRSPMIGRGSQLALLQEVLKEVGGSSSCRLVTVIGEAGLGKSRLVREFAESAPGTVLHGRCISYQEGMTYWPVVQIVKAAAGVSDLDERDEVPAKIAALLAGDEDAALVARQLAVLIGSADGASPGLEETYRAVRRLLESVARSGPVVVVVEDVHWAEPELLDLIEYVVNHSHGAPIMVVCEARPELIERRPGWEGRRAAVVSVRLEPLGKEQASILIENLLGRGRVDDRVLQSITGTAEGNPLFVEELVAMLIEQGVLDRRSQTWRLESEAEELQMPLTIQTLLAARLEQLEHEEREVIQRAAVIGRLFYWRAVSELSPPELRPRVGAHLTSLARRDLIHPERSDFEREDAFSFRHTLIREAAYQASPKAMRAELHEKFAGWLQEAARDRILEYEEFVGYHLEQAAGYRRELGAWDENTEELARRAAHMLASAGRRALASADMASTARLLDRAVSLLDQSDGARTELLGDLAVALSQNGQFARAAEVLDEAIVTATAAGDDRLAARLRVEREVARLEIEPGTTVAEARGAAEPAIEILRELGDDRGLARGWQLIGLDHWSRCRAAEAEIAYNESLVHARRAGDHVTESDCVAMLLTAALWGPTPVSEGIRRCETVRAQSEGDHRTQALTLVELAWFESFRGRFDDARKFRDEADALLTDLGLERMRSVVEMLSADIELMSGNPVGAERALRTGVEALARMGEGGQMPLINALLARALYSLDRLDESEELTRLSERAASPDDIASAILWRGTRAKIAARRGRLTEAQSLARDALAISEEIDFINDQADLLMDAAEVYNMTGDHSQAAELLDRAVELYARKENFVSRRAAEARLDAMRAEL